MPGPGHPRSVNGMPERNVLDRVEEWLRATITHENFVKRRPVIEIVAAAVWFVLPLPHVANWGGALGVIAHLMLAVTLIAYRLQPIVALTLGAIGTLGILGSGFLWSTNYWWIFLPLLAVFFGVAAYGRPPTRWLGLAGTPVAAIGIVAGLGGYGLQLGSVLFYFFLLAIFALAWVGGMLVHVNRSRRAAQTGEIRATVQLGEAKQVATLEQERNRVARDVHDIVAHSLAVVIAQADGARYASKNVPAPVVEALENIASTARGALTDVRVLLGELRHNQEQGPQPGMNDLDSLVRGFRDSGLEVEWNSYGSAIELVGTPALAVYRIVQEGLTNALRHGDRSSPVELVFDWGSTSLAVIITNGLPRGTTAPANTAGHGIPGMRERATLAGGELEASDGTNGRFRVRATIPFARDAVTA
jgi:signal transduction histidine kinase